MEEGRREEGGNGRERGKTNPTNDILMVRQMGLAVLAAVDLVAV